MATKKTNRNTAPRIPEQFAIKAAMQGVRSLRAYIDLHADDADPVKDAELDLVRIGRLALSAILLYLRPKELRTLVDLELQKKANKKKLAA